MHTVYKICFEDKTKETLVVHDNEVYLHNNFVVSDSLKRSFDSSTAALTCAIGFIHVNYKKISSISGEDVDLLRRAFNHSQTTKSFIKTQIVFERYDWKYGDTSNSPIIPNEINLIGVSPQES